MDWIPQIKANENKALTELYKLYRDDCCRWLTKNHKIDSDQAKEIFQASIIILYDNVMSGKLSELTSNIKSYLFSICRNKVMEQIRYNSKISSYDLIFNPIDDGENHIESKKEFEIKIEAVNQAMQSMGDPCKSILQLFYYKKMSMGDITDLMGYKNADTTKNQKYKCLKRLQSLFKDHKPISKQIE